ncbi:ATP-binding cassette domain-containing protein [Staphylococcus americanisciuri]|uniref:ATP-binding cassette domain-containing protein n=1 Tax=Staphylococcus americanisciuri TaxID=2973940 RepID=A0ABT2F378_9STAP|nr:ATP-binding cassette domain-containing protein [Staphylococcus americanisciuri]MCS4486923.1 ATP-binding cassette domain-containing protein [Staphylococcus americanisciuri]
MRYILEAKNISKQYGKELVVNNVNIHVEENTIYGLVGPNGAGKSTILKMITGNTKHTHGSILYMGKQNIKTITIGSLIEEPAIYKNLTAEENLMVFAKLFNVPLNRIQEVLKIVNLKNTKNKKTAQFSLGMKQRLGIAMALLTSPKLLVLDEPTNGLDPVGIKELRELIKSFPEIGITVIVSSHNLAEIQHMTKFVGILNQGTLKYEGQIPENLDLENFFLNILYGEACENNV